MIAGERELVELVVEQIKKYNKPILPVIDLIAFDMKGEDNIVKRLDSLGIMAYSSPEQAISALSRAQDYYRRRRMHK